ncbi:hypothetical protein ACROYT_G006861 [Oculina patagonica]
MSILFSLAWIFMELLPEILADEYSKTARTLHAIANPEKYEKYLRPYHRGDPVNVTVGMRVIHFVAVREMSEEFSMDLVVRQLWRDPRLNHSLSYPITLPGDAKKLIWLPDTFFLNVRSATIHDVISENSKVIINPNGDVIYSTRLTITAGCAMDLADYPLDEQQCDLELSTYAYTRDKLDYKWFEDHRHIHIKDENLAEVTLTHTETLKDVESYADDTHAKLVARFWFKRRLGYAFLQMYIPTIMLVVLSWLSFWIPQGSVPARVALGSTTVLSIVTFTGSFRGSLPKVSYIKAVDIYFIVSFAFIFAAPLEYVLVLLNTRGSEDTRNEKAKESNGGEDVKEIAVEILNKPTKSGTSSMRTALIKNEASFTDKVCRFLFPCCYIIFNVIYWTYYELASFGRHPPDE